MPTLVIQLPNLPPVEHVLKADAITIGRMKGNTIALDDVSVSLSHAKLTRQGDDYLLKDLNSTNGTMLNGQSITEARLRDGDYVKFGEVTGRYFSGVAVSAKSTDLPAQSAVPAPALPTASLVKLSGDSNKSTLSGASAAKFKIIPMAMIAATGIVVVALTGMLVWKFAVGGKHAVVVSPSAEPVPATMELPVRVATSVPSPPLAAPAAAVAVTNQDVPGMVRRLKSTDVGERRRAAALLNALGAGASDAVPALRQAINDSDSEVRMWAALCLIKNNIYDKAVIPILLPLLQHEDPVMRQVACLSLALIPCGEAEKETIIAALSESAHKDGQAEVRSAAVSALKLIVTASPPAGP